MEEVTDSVFRRILCDIGRPDMFVTEFMNVDGYCSPGREKVNQRILFTDIERPIVIQLWGSEPENFVKTVEDVKQLKPDGIEINMGCPDRDVIRTGGGCALISTPSRAVDIIHAVQDVSDNIPVSVKTRIGFESVNTGEWIGLLLDQHLDMLTVHGRTAKQGYNIPADWGEIKKAVNIKNEVSPSTLLIGNGDITSVQQGEEYSGAYGTDGYMIGRAILSNPWIFSGREGISKEERIDTLLKHARLFDEVWGCTKNFNIMKKYVKAYINGFDGANELRQKLMACSNLDEFEKILI
jgi:tRNA-dihydrouridine synthase